MISPIFEARAKICQRKGSLMEDLKTPKNHSKINWPLGQFWKSVPIQDSCFIQGYHSGRTHHIFPQILYLPHNSQNSDETLFGGCWGLSTSLMDIFYFFQYWLLFTFYTENSVFIGWRFTHRVWFRSLWWRKWKWLEWLARKFVWCCVSFLPC